MRHRHLRLTIGIFAGVLAATQAGPVVSTAASSTTPGIIGPGAHPYGGSYSAWSARWWTWALQQPDHADSPIVDAVAGTATAPASVDCSLDQSGPVWFLAGISFLEPYTTAYRTCTVRTGVALFFPVIDSWLDNLSCPGQPPGALTAGELQTALAQQTDSIVAHSMSADVDGTPVKGLSDASTPYRAAAGPFSYSLPVDSPLGPAFCGAAFPAGTAPPPPGAFADGVYLMLAPLSPGRHTVAFAAAEQGGPFGPVTETVTYSITVAP